MAWLARTRRFARPAFAAFLLWHLSCQALRAHSDAARALPGLELGRWLVLSLLGLVWLPFGVFALGELARLVKTSRSERSSVQAATARALAFAEQLALLILMPFTILHVAETAWPLVSGSVAESDVRPELIVLLSSTVNGLPVRAIAYLCAVGAASYYAARQARAALGAAKPSVARGLVALGVLAYLLGCYAVIRCASGEIFP